MINRTLFAFIFLICQSIFAQTEKNEFDEEQKKVDSIEVEQKEKINPCKSLISSIMENSLIVTPEFLWSSRYYLIKLML